MVYCGKPSRGCQMCRTRRIKCDEAKPTCLQCQKSRRQCPGYKEDFDLVFRNETQATERRAKRATTASKKANAQLSQARKKRQQDSSSRLQTNGSTALTMSATTTTTTTTTTDVSSAPSNAYLFSPTSANGDYTSLPLIVSAASIPGQINVSMDDQAIHFFLSNWVLLPHQGSTRGYLDFLLPLMRTSPPNSHLSLSFSAVGLAALANRNSPGINSKGLVKYARQKYDVAIKQTGKAVHDPKLQREDSTLASVLLLGLFEQILSERTHLAGWGSHIDGAVQLIKMRGKKQLRTSIGKGLFIAVRTQMVVNCSSSSKPPLLGVEFWTTENTKDPWGQEITRLNLRVAELRAEVNKVMTMAPRTSENMSKVFGLMRRAQSLEEEYLLWQSTLPAEWTPKETIYEGDDLVPGQESDWLIYPGLVECFTDIWQASVWQMSRVSRLFLSGIVVRCAAWLCAPADYRETPEYATAATLASDMVCKIISVIPFLLGWGFRDFDGIRRVDTVKNGDFAVGGGGGLQKAHPRALGGFFALWPLFAVACSDFADESQRKWVNGRLRWIGGEMGVNQAQVLSQFHFRMPSMTIKRDGMGISAPNARDMAKHGGPTANLPPAARPVKMEKIHHVPFAAVGVEKKVKVDDDHTPTASGTSSVIGGGGSPLILNGSGNGMTSLSMTPTQTWVSEAQLGGRGGKYHQMDLEEGYASSQQPENKINGTKATPPPSRYPSHSHSPQPYPTPKDEPPDHPNHFTQTPNPSTNNTLFSHRSPQPPQSLYSSHHHHHQQQLQSRQNQGGLGYESASPSYNHYQTSRTGTGSPTGHSGPSPYSITSTSMPPHGNENQHTETYGGTDTYGTGFETAGANSFPSSHQAMAIQRVTTHNHHTHPSSTFDIDMDMGNGIDHLGRISTSETHHHHHSPHSYASSSSLSPINTYDTTMRDSYGTQSPQHQILPGPYQNINSAFDPYSTSSSSSMIMDFKQENPLSSSASSSRLSIFSPTTSVYGGGNHGHTHAHGRVSVPDDDPYAVPAWNRIADTTQLPTAGPGPSISSKNNDANNSLSNVQVSNNNSNSLSQQQDVPPPTILTSQKDNNLNSELETPSSLNPALDQDQGVHVFDYPAPENSPPPLFNPSSALFNHTNTNSTWKVGLGPALDGMRLRGGGGVLGLGLDIDGPGRRNRHVLHHQRQAPAARDLGTQRLI